MQLLVSGRILSILIIEMSEICSHHVILRLVCQFLVWILLEQLSN